jgi:hypothetical protein
MPLPGRGRTVLKPVLGVVILGVLLSTGAKVFPIYSNSSQLADYIQDKAAQWAARNPSPGSVQAEVVHYARGLGLPVSAEQVSVTSDQGTLSIKVDYKVPVNLKVVTWNLHFTPWVLSRAY